MDTLQRTIAPLVTCLFVVLTGCSEDDRDERSAPPSGESAKESHAESLHKLMGKLQSRVLADQKDGAISLVPLPNPSTLFEINLGTGSKGPGEGRLAVLNWRTRDRREHRYDGGVFDNPAEVREFPGETHHSNSNRMREVTASSRIIVDGYDRPTSSERDAEIRSMFGLDSSNSIAGYDPLGNGFDSAYPSLASDLRFLGSTNDFRVLAKASSSKAPEWLVPSEDPLEPFLPGETFAGHRGWFSHEFLRAWHRPIIHQVIGHSVIAEVQANASGFGATISLYHRDPNSSLPADHTPIDVSGLDGLMFFIIEPLQPDDPDVSAMENGFPTEFRGVKITQQGSGTGADTIYELRNSDTGGTATIIREDEEVAACTLTVSDEEDTEIENSYVREFHENGAPDPVSKTEVTLNADLSSWKSHQFSDPACAATLLVSGSGSETQTTTFDPHARFPTKIVTETDNSPTSEASWTESGFPIGKKYGDWLTFYSETDGAMEVTSKLGEGSENAYSKSWVEWTKQGSVVKVFDAPHLSTDVSDGVPITKSYSGNSQTVLTYDVGDAVGRSAVPWGLIKTSFNSLVGSKTTYTRTESNGLTIVTESGRLNTGLTDIVRGVETTTTINSSGFTTSSLQRSVPGGSTIGGWSSSGSNNPWKGPETIHPAVPAGLPDQTMTYESDYPLVASSTSSFGVVNEVTKLDWAARATSYSWDGHKGTIKYNDGQLGIDNKITVDGRVKNQICHLDKLGRVEIIDVQGNQNFLKAFSRTGDQLEITAENKTTLAESILSVDQDLGSATTIGGNLSLPSTAGLEVQDGLLKSTAQLTASSATKTETYSDAWGRVHIIIEPSSAGGTQETTFEYSDPGDATQRVIMNDASGKILVQQSENPIDPAVMSVARIGYDVDADGELNLPDRFTEVATSITGSSITAVTKRSAEGGSAAYLQVISSTEQNLVTGASTTVVNGGEETVSSTLAFPSVASGTAYQVYTNSSAGWSAVTSYDNKGKLILSSSSGSSIPTSTLSPTWHADGSLEELEAQLGGSRSSMSFAPDQRVTGISDPIMGEHVVLQKFENDGISTSVDSLDQDTFFKYNATNSRFSGDNIVDEERTVTLGTTGFTEEIDATEVSQKTTISSNASGANTAKNYQAGLGIQNTWLAGGLISTVSRARGGNVRFFYTDDGARDLKTIQYPASGGDSLIEEKFAYGADGNTKTITDQSGSRTNTWTHDRLEFVDYTAGLLGGYEVDPQFDGLGRRTGVIVRKGGVIVHDVDYYRWNENSDELTGAGSSWTSAIYDRDPDNRWITKVNRGSANLTYQRDGSKAGRLVRIGSEVAGAPSFKYQRFDKFGRRTSVLSNQGNWHYDYGNNGHLTRARSSNGPDFLYPVDAIGRRTNFMNSGGMGPVDNASYNLNQPNGSFGDDPGSLLGSGNFKLNIQGAWGTDLYVTDRSGTYGPLTGGTTNFEGITSFHWSQNLSGYPYGGWHHWSVKGVLKDQGDPGAHEDAVSQIDGLTWINPTYGSYSHDADGNRQSAPGWHYRFDGRNRLVGAETEDYATNPTGTRLTFEYDSDGRRVEKVVTTKTFSNGSSTESTVTAHFVWDGWDLLYECHREQNTVILERRYVWGADLSGSMGGAGGAGGLLAMQVTENGTTTTNYYPIYDGSGNVVGLADQGGTLVAEYRYGPFGELIQATGPAAQANPWRFATKYEDLETRLVYFGHRYFDSITGNWLSREPLGESESLNLYAYCHGDPINKVDFLGLAEIASTGGEPSFVGEMLAAAVQDGASISAAQDLLLRAQIRAELTGVDFTASDVVIKESVTRAIQQAFRDTDRDWEVLRTRLLGLRTPLFLDSPQGRRADNEISAVMSGLAPALAARGAERSRQLELLRQREHAESEAIAAYYSSFRGKMHSLGNGLAGMGAFVANEAAVTPLGGGELHWAPFTADGFDFSNGSVSEASSLDRGLSLLNYTGLGFVRTSGSVPLKAGGFLRRAPKTTPSSFARSLQGAGDYPGVDRFRDITLKRGATIFGGAPGQSNFYTTASGVRRANGSSSSLFQGLQVGKAGPHIPSHPITGRYRPGVTAYEVTQDIPAAFGRTLNNPQFGSGRFPQIVIENYQDYLRPVYSIPLGK